MRARSAGEPARHREEEPDLPLVPRARLLRLPHAAGDPAQRPREPRLVHGVHAVSGRDRAGTPRGAAELPDDGHGPHRAGDRERVAARRRDGGRRGDGDVATRRAASRARKTFFVSDACHPQTIDVVKTRAHARGVTVVVGDWRRRTIGDDVFGALLQYPATDGARARLPRSSASARTRSNALVTVGDRPAEPRAARRRRASGAPTSASATRSASACRWATAARTPRSSRRRTSSSDSCPAASSACRATRTASRRCAWRCRRASSTSAARRRRATSAPRRCCSR